MGDEVPIAAVVGSKKKKDDKHRRRDPRSWDNLQKVISDMVEPDKTEYIGKKYTDLYTENRNLSATLQTREKQMVVIQKDSDRDKTELTKSIMARGHLESLCRELQKQNKLVKEENVARIKEEEDRRREVANTFTERLNALTNLITESKDKSNKVKEENQNMTEKLTELYDQYQQRENHLETVTKQLDLQKKLAETQAKKTEIEQEAERQTYVAEKKALLMQLEQYEREMVLLQEKNRSLEAQVDLYKSQYSDFETTMTKSNKVFDTFKEEMSRMNKRLHTLEKERNDLRKRWQSSVNSLIDLSEQHVALSNEQSALEKRLVMLQKLCRQLQEDRSAFIKQLKENNIEPVVPTIKNNETCENDASQQNSDNAKSTQRALGLKQELGKVKEVAAFTSVRAFHDEIGEAYNHVSQKLDSILAEGLVNECLADKKLVEELDGHHGEGDLAKAGTSQDSECGTEPITDKSDLSLQSVPEMADAATQVKKMSGPSHATRFSQMRQLHVEGRLPTPIETIDVHSSDSESLLNGDVENAVVETAVVENVDVENADVSNVTSPRRSETDSSKTSSSSLNSTPDEDDECETI